MSPEQIRGETLDGRSDIYSLGVVLYELATGRAPFRAETPAVILVKHLLDALPPPRTFNPDLSEGVQRVILKSLAKERDDRSRCVWVPTTGWKRRRDTPSPTTTQRRWHPTSDQGQMWWSWWWRPTSPGRSGPSPCTRDSWPGAATIDTCLIRRPQR
jgi:serine/threonine protein kinase